MGQEIVYCSRCQSRLLAGEFEGGKGFWVQGKPCCLDCLQTLLSTLPPDEERRLLSEIEGKRQGTSTVKPAGMPAPPPKPARKTSTAHIQIQKVKTERRFVKQGGSPVLIIGAVGAGILLLLLVGMAARPRPRPSRPPPPPPPPRTAVETPVPSPTPGPDRREEAAHAALEKARRWRADDVPGRIEAYEEAVWQARGTQFFAEARREHEALQKERADRIAAELGPAQAESKAERFGAAIDLLGKARAKLSGADWTAAVDQAILRTRHEAETLYRGVKEKAVRGEDAAGAVARVKAWGLAELDADLKRALDAVPPLGPARSPEAVALEAAWRRATALGAGRDYAGAAKAAEGHPDEPLLRELEKAQAAAHKALVEWPKGQPIALEIEDPSGDVVKVEGTVVKSEPGSIEIKGEGETVVVMFDQLTSAGLRALFPAKPSDPAIDLFGRLEAPRPKDAPARKLFEAAERDFHDPAAILSSFDRYRALQAMETPFVRRRAPTIQARLAEEKEAGREHLVAADRMRAGGAFRRETVGKIGCWTSGADKESTVEFTFAARADAEYRCWVYVGGCCAEVLAFHHQLGGEPAVAGKPAALFLKKLHVQHGGPKQPAKFEWVAIPLPKFAAAGPRTLKLASFQQGFAVAGACVSAKRTASPGETWLRDAVVRAAAKPVDFALVGWWTLDQAAEDASPNGLGGTARNDPVWVAGKKKGALSFDGRDDYVEVPKSPKLFIPGPLTVAAWVKPSSYPTSEFGMYVVSDYVENGDRCALSLRVMSNGAAQFFWQHEATHFTHATSKSSAPLGAWTHLAGVWDGSVRRLYVNGVAEGENAQAQPRADAGGRLSIGRPGDFNGLYFRGAIDDVRLYSRALTPAEIRDLAQ